MSERDGIMLEKSVCKLVTALSETLRLMAEIDAAIPNWPME